jgi:cell division protein FtsW
MVKFSLAVYLAYSMSKKGSDLELFTKGLLPHLLVVGTFMVLIYLQPDLGTAVIIGTWTLVLLFVGGVRILPASNPISAGSAGFRISGLECRIQGQEVAGFLNPWDDPKGIGFQIIHSFLAFGSGGIFGAGLGNSKQKLFYLPEPHTDFALSIMGEELGLVGVIRHHRVVRGSHYGRHSNRPKQQRSLQHLSGPGTHVLSGPSGDCQYGRGSGIAAHKRAHPSPSSAMGVHPW